MKDTQVSADTETITPEVASAILAQNGRNRSISANRIRQLVGAMERGEFNGQNGETIKLTKDGHLEDGQHRLISIVESGTTQKLLVARGVPEGSQETIDIGRARTFGDMLRIRGELNPNTLGAASRMIWAYERKGIPSCAGVPVQPTPQQLFECLERHPRLRQSVDAGGHQRSMFMLTRSQVMGLHYLFASVDREDADEFFRRLNTGEELSAGDPLFALRERFIRALSNTDKMRDIVVLAFTIRAWNAWRAGERLTKLQWKPGGAHPDRFPRIEGCQIALSEAGD